MNNRELGYTSDDYREGVPPRAMGTETEFTDNIHVESFIDRYAHGSRLRKLENYVDPQYLVSVGRRATASIVTTNGGEIYLDNKALEYATPECRDPQETALHERIGEQIIDDIIQRIGKTRSPKASVYKRSGYAEVEGKRLFESPLIQENSIGHHESYTSKSELMKGSYFDILKRPIFYCLSDFLALRKLIDGAGMVAEDHFSITQKPNAFDYRAFQSHTMHGIKKPVQQKDDRLEVRTGEASKSDWATAFKLGLTSLVLRMIEHEKFPEHLKLYDPNIAVLRLASDPLGYVMLDSGERMRGIDVLKGIVDAAYETVNDYSDLPEYERQAYTDFLQFYDDMYKISLKDNDVTALSDRIDWAARYAFFLRRGASYNSFTTDDLQQVQYDLLWDRIGEKDIARRWFSRFGHTALKVELAPPPHTRAESRVALARKYYQNGTLASVLWDSVIKKDGTMYISNHPLDLHMLPRNKQLASYPEYWEEEG